MHCYFNDDSNNADVDYIASLLYIIQLRIKYIDHHAARSSAGN